MVKKPRDIGSMWMGYNKKFVHGPRFYNPDMMTRLWVQGHNQSFPRYIMGETKTGAVIIQSVLRPVYPGELPYFERLIAWKEALRAHIFPTLRINPFATYDHSKYIFYSFSFNKSVLDSLINHISEKNYYRVKEITSSGIKVYVLYRRMK